jgi:hypothetical protein
VEADPEECLLPEEAKINFGFSFQLSKAKFNYKVVIVLKHGQNQKGK